MNEEDKQALIQRFNIKIGDDINNLSSAYQLEDEIVAKRERLQNTHNSTAKIPPRVLLSVEKAKKKPSEIAELKEKSEKLQSKVEQFLVKTDPLRNELNSRFAAINKLEKVLCYLKTYEVVNDLCQQLSSCNDDEQSVLLYGALKELCLQYPEGHRGSYIKEYTHYWHNILKDKLTKQYEDVLKQLKWPVVMTADMFAQLPKDVMPKLHGLTKFLFLIEEPDDEHARIVSEDFSLENPCLPVKILLRPLKKRFLFHFTGSRQTARIDRPEWFLTQTLTWIKDHQGFVRTNIQPIADKLNMMHIRTVDEFNAGLISFAAERLHTVLGMYNSQGAKNEKHTDMDAAFAHAVDEALGFHRELVLITGLDVNSVLSVLTKAEMFVKWLVVEKKYALAKMDEMLDSETWTEPIAGGKGSAVGTVLWVPRGADWFISLLKTIEDRYAVLPQPGHRLQFLELQLELMEEWRVRLTQLLSAATSALDAESFVQDGAPDPLTAVVNAAHHSRSVLLQWAHSLHYLQLHYYRRQFQHFTQQQHQEEPGSASGSDDEEEVSAEDDEEKKSEDDEALSLKEVEQKAKNLALDDVRRRSSLLPPVHYMEITNPLTIPAVPDTADPEAGVFADAPGLLERLREAGLSALVEHSLLEFRAGMRDYRRQKWHAMLVVEEIAICVSTPLCRPLSALVARLNNVCAKLAPILAFRFRGQLAENVDQYIFEEVVLESWFNTGGTMQFTHDVKRNLVPAFAPPNKCSLQANLLPKLLDSCKLLNMEYEDARRLRSLLQKHPSAGADSLFARDIQLSSADALRILDQRTDLTDGERSVMDLF